jgi:hypothetical protein
MRISGNINVKSSAAFCYLGSSFFLFLHPMTGHQDYWRSPLPLYSTPHSRNF